ncbi:hypothetical protein Y032_0234g3135 [Ancylostoma ceylanicum]|uniref:Protein kinase domain-containing protein n=1 Tax=Ancylostoma ceylanicum TaxID=53326 RepID=A0A016SF52_9BILA|nr:hypothetical protein Y032_0234g3135 [Ancylostoma ceylanicum]
MIVANQLERHAIEGDPVLVGRGDQPAQLHPSKVRGKNAPQYLDKGTLLSKKYRLEKMIGGGGFGQIYRATDIVSAFHTGPTCCLFIRFVRIWVRWWQRKWSHSRKTLDGWCSSRWCSQSSSARDIHRDLLVLR